MKKIILTSVLSICFLAAGFAQRANSKDIGVYSLKEGDVIYEIVNAKFKDKKGRTYDLKSAGKNETKTLLVVELDKSSPLIAHLKRTGKKEIPTLELTAQIDGWTLNYKLDRCRVKSWSTSGDADDRPTEEVAFYYNKIAHRSQKYRD